MVTLSMFGSKFLKMACVSKYLFLKGFLGKDIFADMMETLGDQCPSYAAIKSWIPQFKGRR